MKKLLPSLFICMFFALAALAQDRTINGTVTSSEDKLPIPGVSVKIQGATGAPQLMLTESSPLKSHRTLKLLYFLQSGLPLNPNRLEVQM
ncbi:carboxypeptidase-like regulatory domain-containing protein [Pedobacter riviphilus]|uniref:carboxypeptidase-like regulatory domain-containing protein n=1 Tax=Pedobacter riviphilus TaxID=2766984 RepID=UPI001CC2702B|nr:carboxypeptidase-like regulatory domain-containing protein [Pedobacter riviphilus]